MRYFLSLALLVISLTAFSQKTIALGDKTSPQATLSDVAWITGSWEGEAFGGQVQEVWAPPLGDSMMCAFKLVVDGKVEFYELCQIREESGSLVLRLKHFNGDLKGWEEKDETVDFKLVKVEKDIVYFDGFTVERVSKDKINMHVMIGEAGEESEVTFNYSRAK
ncbi:DUF6265 family protein [Roseivirga sp.]|nr:DUF6265 family protein [Roseivirga sp.]